MRPKPKVGQIVYLPERKWTGLGVSNHATILVPLTVTKVGRKLFYVNRHGRDMPFFLDTWVQKHEFGSPSVLYESEQEWKNEVESNNLFREIEEYFRYGNNNRKLSVETLKAIKTLMEGKV